MVRMSQSHESISDVSERTPRGEQRREAILRGTLRLIAARGPEAVTHRAVAEEAGVPLAATTYYFDSKNDLLEQALLLAAAEEVERFEDRVADVRSSDDPGAWITAMTKGVVADRAEKRAQRIASFELALEAARRPGLREAAMSWQQGYLRLAEEGLRSAGSPTPEADAVLLVAALVGFDLAQLYAPEIDERTARPFFEHLVARFTGARRARSGAGPTTS
jgi:DNA-binding transcriptional regulator YbjK